ncbi:uncharacterized protein LOC110686326 [Chenopodium quinoa]|uniref:uncharacterized protein LOC110686326 n=1 Tax=Chenopodium quinoa TaxID=63459 RepID=UPI000B78C3C5|nr:uncharacterized protein LOC110686326 [Chenopodium quinoa]
MTIVEYNSNLYKIRATSRVTVIILFKRSALAAISDISHIVDLLLEKDDSSAYARDSDGFTPLLRAVHSDLLGIAMRILYHCPQSIKQYDYEGRNIFHWIKFRRNDDRIREFLKVVPHMGVFIRSSDNKEEMPLHLAIKNNEFGTVKFLLENLDELKGWWNILDYNMRIVPDLLAITQDIPRWFLDFFSSKFSELPNELAWTAGRSLYGIHKKEIKEHMSSLGLVAALLTTLTFTAAFTLPRGSNDENGTPVLAKKVMFKVFMFSDLLGMCSSIMVLFCLIWFLTTSHICSSEDLLLVDMTICLLQVSFYSTLVAFMAGVYVTTYSSNPSLAISTCVLCSVIILLMRKRLVVAFMLKAFLIIYFLTGMCARAITLTIKKISTCLRLRR